MRFDGKRVVVVGLGKSGLSAVRLLLAEGASVTVEETKPRESLNLGAELTRVTLEAGRPLDAQRLLVHDLIVVSPGVPLTLPALEEARARGRQVIGEAELAYGFLDHAVPLVGITGTNGKSTTTALAGELFSQGGLGPFVGGNLGTALSDAALRKGVGAYVVEYSSFQLEGVVDTHVTAAAFLNLTPDHLDRYPSLEAYGAAKARIFANQTAKDLAVFNADDPWTTRLASLTRAERHGFTLDPNARPEQLGLPWLARPCPGGFERLARDEKAEPYRLENRALRGAHNLQNAMAATLLARFSRVSPEAVQRGLDAFPGLPHRLEFVRTLGGVEWVNDSKATNVDSSVIALRAFQDQRLWLIAGGKGKGAPYSPLKKAAGQKVAGVLTVGQDAGNIEKEFGDVFAVYPCQTLSRAVAKARELAKPGDVVLLSPACASYDQFQNFEDRGDTFKRLVNALE